MTDSEQTLREHSDEPRQGGTPGADAPGDAARRSGAAAEALPREDDAAEIEGDLDELVRTAAQRDEYLALAQRTQADFENYRKRVARESAAAQERGAIALARELLPALDNLDRALEDAGVAADSACSADIAGGTAAGAARGADGAAGRDDPLLAGVRLVRSELAAALARAGIESYSPAGEIFDPALHEAVATAEQAPDGEKSGTVVEVYQRGYRLGTNVIRPARVVVAA